MSDLELLNICVDSECGIECSTAYSELSASIELVHDQHTNLESESCSKGACPLKWKPQRHNAA
jgi:hypothetical protein